MCFDSHTYVAISSSPPDSSLSSTKGDPIPPSGSIRASDQLCARLYLYKCVCKCVFLWATWVAACSAVHMQDEILANGIPSDNPAFIRLQNFLFWYVCGPGQMEFSSCQQKAHFVVHSLLTLKYLRKLSSGKLITSNFNQAAALTYLRLDWASFILPHKIIRSDFRKVQLGGHAEISLQLTTKVTSS